MSTNGEHSISPGHPPGLVEGTVEARNRTGIKVNGDWFTISKFRPVEVPSIGVRVRLSVDDKGFISGLEVVQPASESPAVVSREQTIARLAVLKAAAYFSAARSDIKSADVLTIAERWLKWVEE